MHKDLNKHTDSNCTYPPVKPNNQEASQNRRQLARGDYQDEGLNGFALGEIDRLMMASSDRPSAMPSQSRPSKQNNRSKPNLTRNFTGRLAKRSNEVAANSRHQRDVNDLRSYDDDDELDISDRLARDLAMQDPLDYDRDMPYLEDEDLMQGEKEIC